MHGNLSGPPKAVCYTEVSNIRGVCCKRFHCTQSGASYNKHRIPVLLSYCALHDNSVYSQMWTTAKSLL